MSGESRVEKVLQHILGGLTPTEPSMSRVEQILLAIAGEDSPYGLPLSRIEKLLQKWHGESVVLEPPKSRIELLLYKIVGEDVTIEPPLSRVEDLLSEIAEGDTTLAGISFEGDSWFDIPIILTGRDVLRFTYSARINCNVLGSYISSTVDNNFSFYHGLTVYARYGDQLNRVNARTNTEYSVVIGSSGFDFDGNHYDFTPSDFVCGTNLIIGKLPNSSQPELKGYLRGPLVIDGRLTLIPVQTKDGVIGYRDRSTGTLYVNQGTGTVQPYV